MLRPPPILWGRKTVGIRGKGSVELREGKERNAARQLKTCASISQRDATIVLQKTHFRPTGVG